MPCRSGQVREAALGLMTARSRARSYAELSLRKLAALPERVQREAKTALHRVSGAPTRAGALDAARAFGEQFAQRPKAGDPHSVRHDHATAMKVERPEDGPPEGPSPIQPPTPRSPIQYR